MKFTSIRKLIFSLSFLFLLTNHNMAIAEGSNPFILYTPAINAAAEIARYTHCVNIESEKCNVTHTTCSRSIDQQISDAIAKCFNEKMSCYAEAKVDYDYCCDREGDRVCPKYCKDKYNDDITICDSIGARCIDNVFETDFKEPNLTECHKDYQDCLMNLLASCDPFFLHQ